MIINFFDSTGIKVATTDITKKTIPEIAKLLEIQEKLGRTWGYHKN